MWKHYLIGLAISAAAGWLFLRFVDLQQMGQALATMNAWWLLPCLAFYVMSYVFRTFRWHYLMRPVASVRFYPLFAALLIGFLGNNLLPAHLGEVVRAYVLGRSEKVSKSSVFATVVLERIYDGLTVLFLLMLVLLFMELPEGGGAGSGGITVANLRTAGWLGLAVFAGLMIGLQLLRWQRTRMLACLGFCLRPLPERLAVKGLEMAGSFADGLALSRAADLLHIVLHSLMTWGFLGLYAWSLFPAFGLGLGVMAGMLMEVVVALALLIPSAPAFLGTFHLAAAFTLGYLGADAGQAGSYAMVLWLVHFVSTTGIGLVLLWRQGLGWGALKGQDA
jgi:uncharacterized membrane protein YbhN (UPF0104 family)